MDKKVLCGVVFGCLGYFFVDMPLVEGAESGKSFYLLGIRSDYAGITLPPGFYVQNDLYFYDGHAGASTKLPFGGEFAAGVDGTAVITMPTLLFVAPQPILGGFLGFSATVPLGWQDINAAATFTTPNGTQLGINVDDQDFQVGDPILGAQIGWHSGNFHWNLATAVNVPAGSWEQGQLVNLGFNRWAVDLSGAATWLDMVRGWEASGAVGFTFNGNNLDTDYQTGTEMHAELAVSKLFANGMSVGIAGYQYVQLTGDSGSDAKLGDFKGRVTAIGPTLGLTVPLGDRDLTARFRWYHEFAVKNRLEGDAVFLTVAVPLQPSQRPPSK
jgi:hypothetical protein